MNLAKFRYRAGSSAAGLLENRPPPGTALPEDEDEDETDQADMFADETVADPQDT